VFRLAEHGLSAADVAMHLWFGMERLDRPALIDQIRHRGLTPEQAARQIRQYRSAG